MVDTITLKIEPALKPIEVYRETKTLASTKVFSRCRNLELITNEDYTILKGSLPKFVHGSNIITLPFDEVFSTIQDLSNQLERDISNAQILGVDWSTTISTETKPTVYYSILGETHPFRRVHFMNSLYYNTNAKVLLFYDKGKEAKAIGNLLRNEVRWTNLKKYGLHFSDLAKPDVFNKFTEQWLETYVSINKIRKPMPKQIRNPKDWNRFMQSVALEALGGKDGAFEIVNNLHAQRDIAPHHKTRIKQNINQLIQNIGYPSNLEEELNLKFYEVAKKAFVV